MKLIVTGAGGFLGSRILGGAPKTWQIVALLHGQAFAVHSHGYTLDITNPKHIRALADREGQADAILHLAGKIDICFSFAEEGRPLPCNTNVSDLFSTNVGGTSLVIELAERLKVSRFVFASSQSVYGFGVNGMLDERSPVKPMEHYAYSKLACEQMVLEGLRYTDFVSALRLSGLYGPERTHGTIWKFCHDAVTKGEILFEPKQPIPYSALSVSDASRAVVQMLGHSNGFSGIYNVGPAEATSLRVFAETIAKAAGSAILVDNGVDQPEIAMNLSRIKGLTGWAPMPMKASLLEMIDSIRHAQ